VDIRDLNRRSARATVELVAGITSAGLERPTPCSEWTVRGLLEHHAAQNYGFAFAASGRKSGLDLWEPLPLGDDAAGRYAASVEAVIAAFAEPGVLERDFWLPEFPGDKPFPARMAIGFHFIDCVVHGWDLAKGLGVPPNVDADLAEAALPMAAMVPDDPDTRGPGRPFHAGLDAPESIPTLDRVAALLGRSPRWPEE
jgi:uncharacterized protein (TIGR03086 family)